MIGSSTALVITSSNSGLQVLFYPVNLNLLNYKYIFVMKSSFVNVNGKTGKQILMS